MKNKKSFDKTALLPEWIKKKNGIQFQCQGSGKCCISRGEYGYVYLTLNDRKNLAAHLDISVHKFTRNYCHKNEGLFALTTPKKQNECIFLKNLKCSVYEARPTQCKTWPFWPEVLEAKEWKQDVVKFCPGANKGKKWSLKEIAEQVYQQNESNKKL